MRSKLRLIYSFLVPKTIRDKFAGYLLGEVPEPYLKNKFIFIHIPKTGGKAVIANFGIGRACHKSFIEYQEILGSDLNSYYCFSIVRDPVERFVSAYNYLYSGGNGSWEDHRISVKLKEVVSPEGFFNDPERANSILEYRHFIPQYKYLLDKKGSIANINIFDYSHLSDAVEVLSERVGVALDLHEVNMTQQKYIKADQLSEEVIKKIKEIYSEDYKVFGERFGWS